MVVLALILSVPFFDMLWNQEQNQMLVVEMSRVLEPYQYIRTGSRKAAMTTSHRRIPSVCGDKPTLVKYMHFMSFTNIF